MNEILRALSEMLNNKEVKSMNIRYERIGDTETVSAGVEKTNNKDITINIDTFNSTNGADIEVISKELSNLAKRHIT